MSPSAAKTATGILTLRVRMTAIRGEADGGLMDQRRDVGRNY